MSLTPRQLEVLQYIRSYRSTHSVSPTYREIARELGISKTAVMEHIQALVDKGALTRGDPKKSRNLEPTDEELIAKADAVGVVAAHVDRKKPSDKVGDLGPRLKTAIELIPARGLAPPKRRRRTEETK